MKSTFFKESLIQQIELDDEDLEMIYGWVDAVPQSRPKRNIMRDFSDGNQLAHIIRFYLPHKYKGIVQVHNYVETSNKQVKLENWTQLNQKILPKLNLHLTLEEILGVVNYKPMMIEMILFKLKHAMEKFISNPPPDDLTYSKATQYIKKNLAKQVERPKSKLLQSHKQLPSMQSRKKMKIKRVKRVQSVRSQFLLPGPNDDYRSPTFKKDSPVKIKKLYKTLQHFDNQLQNTRLNVITPDPNPANISLNPQANQIEDQKLEQQVTMHSVDPIQANPLSQSQIDDLGLLNPGHLQSKSNDADDFQKYMMPLKSSPTPDKTSDKKRIKQTPQKNDLPLVKSQQKPSVRKRNRSLHTSPRTERKTKPAEILNPVLKGRNRKMIPKVEWKSALNVGSGLFQTKSQPRNPSRSLSQRQMVDGRSSMLQLKEYSPEQKQKSVVKRKSEVNKIVERLHRGYKNKQSCMMYEFPEPDEPLKSKKKSKSQIRQQRKSIHRLSQIKNEMRQICSGNNSSVRQVSAPNSKRSFSENILSFASPLSPPRQIEKNQKELKEQENALKKEHRRAIKKLENQLRMEFESELNRLQIQHQSEQNDIQQKHQDEVNELQDRLYELQRSQLLNNQQHAQSVADYEIILQRKEDHISNLNEKITSLEALQVQSTHQLTQQVQEIEALRAKNQALEDEVHKLVNELTAEKSKKMSKSKRASSFRNKTPQSSKGVNTIKRMGKKYADERELSQSPNRKSERRSTLQVNFMKKKFFEESKSNKDAVSEQAKHFSLTKNLNGEIRQMDILSHSTFKEQQAPNNNIHMISDQLSHEKQKVISLEKTLQQERTLLSQLDHEQRQLIQERTSIEKIIIQERARCKDIEQQRIQQLETIRREESQFDQDLIQWARKKTEKQTEIDEVKRSVRIMEEDVRREKEREDNIQKQIQIIRDQQKSMNQELLDLESLKFKEKIYQEQELYEQESTKWKKQKEQREKEIEQIIKQVKNLEQQLKQEKEREEAFAKDIKIIRESQINKQKEIKELQMLKEERKLEEDQLKQERAEWLKLKEQMQMEIDVLKRNSKELEESIGKLKEVEVNLKKESGLLSEKVLDLRNEIEQLKRQNEKLSNERDQLKKMTDQVQKPINIVLPQSSLAPEAPAQVIDQQKPKVVKSSLPPVNHSQNVKKDEKSDLDFDQSSTPDDPLANSNQQPDMENYESPNLSHILSKDQPQDPHKSDFLSGAEEAGSFATLAPAIIEPIKENKAFRKVKAAPNHNHQQFKKPEPQIRPEMNAEINQYHPPKPNAFPKQPLVMKHQRIQNNRPIVPVGQHAPNALLSGELSHISEGFVEASPSASEQPYLSNFSSSGKQNFHDPFKKVSMNNATYDSQNIKRTYYNSPTNHNENRFKNAPSGPYLSPGNFDDISDGGMSPNRVDIANMGQSSASYMQKPNLQERNYALNRNQNKILPIGAIRGKDTQNNNYNNMHYDGYQR